MACCQFFSFDLYIGIYPRFSGHQARLPENAYLEDESDPDSACGFLPDPFPVVNDPALFSDDGKVLLLRYISRFAQYGVSLVGTYGAQGALLCVSELACS